jgi:hypothetical protein
MGGQPATQAAELTNAGFLADSRTGLAVLARSGGAVVVHGAAASGRQLSRVDARGAIAWTATLEGSCQLATEFEGVLVLASADGKHRARGVDLATGALRFHVTFD